MPASDRLKHRDLMRVALILGGSAFVSRAAWDAGNISLRAYTKAGKPRNRRNSTLPLKISRVLTIDAIGEPV